MYLFGVLRDWCATYWRHHEALWAALMMFHQTLCVIWLIMALQWTAGMVKIKMAMVNQLSTIDTH